MWGRKQQVKAGREVVQESGGQREEGGGWRLGVGGWRLEGGVVDVRLGEAVPA